MSAPLAAGVIATMASAQETRQADADGRPSDLAPPLGIALEGWPYPAPVGFHSVDWDGERVRMAYMDVAATGPPNGRTVFLLHGKNFDSSYWSGPMAWLAAAGYRVVVPDQIGFNKSAKPGGEYRFSVLAANTLALADRLSVDRFDLIGQSTGGMLATVIASGSPTRVSRLVLEDPIGLIDYRDYIPLQSLETLIAAEHAYTPDSYRRFVAHFFPVLPPSEYERFVTWRMRVAGSGEFDRFAVASASTYQMIYGQPVVPLFPRLTMPVLLTAGTEDRSVPLISYAAAADRDRIPLIPEAARKVVRTIPAGSLVAFPGVGHVPHLEAAERFRKVVLDFLSR